MEVRQKFNGQMSRFSNLSSMVKVRVKRMDVSYTKDTFELSNFVRSSENQSLRISNSGSMAGPPLIKHSSSSFRPTLRPFCIHQEGDVRWH